MLIDRPVDVAPDPGDLDIGLVDEPAIPGQVPHRPGRAGQGCDRCTRRYRVTWSTRCHASREALRVPGRTTACGQGRVRRGRRVYFLGLCQALNDPATISRAFESAFRWASGRSVASRGCVARATSSRRRCRPVRDRLWDARIGMSGRVSAQGNAACPDVLGLAQARGPPGVVVGERVCSVRPPRPVRVASSCVEGGGGGAQCSAWPRKRS